MKKKIYESPVVEQMECKVEKGFAGSGATAPQNVEGLTTTHNYDNDALFN